MRVAADKLTVTPSDGLASSGYQGGPFTPSNKVYTLSNTGTSNLTWAASWAAPWMGVAPSNGTLAAGATTDVTVALTAQAGTLPPGTNADTVVFSNLSSGVSQSRSVQLVVRERVLDHFAWDPIAPPTQYVGRAFPVKITAQDATSSTLSGFTNSVLLSSSLSAGARCNESNG